MYNNIYKFGDSIQRIKNSAIGGEGWGGMGMIYSVIVAFTFPFGAVACSADFVDIVVYRACILGSASSINTYVVVCNSPKSKNSHIPILIHEINIGI